MPPTLPGVNANDFIKGFPCLHVEGGEVWIYLDDSWYYLAVFGTYGRGDINAAFKLKRRHRKRVSAEKRAVAVSKSWGKDT